MELSSILSNIILWTFLHTTLSERLVPLKKYHTPCPNECDLKKCPKLSICNGEIVKDRCGCCPDCSTNAGYNTTLSESKTEDGACKKVSCPRYKVCMENMQGLPLCTCPNPFVCRGRRRQVCGQDGVTYESRCHMRVISCHKAQRLKMAHKGACGMVGTQQEGKGVTYAETEFDISAKRRKNRKQMKKKNRKAKKRRQRRKQKNKNKKLKRLKRQRRRKGKDNKAINKDNRKNRDKNAVHNND